MRNNLGMLQWLLQQQGQGGQGITPDVPAPGDADTQPSPQQPAGGYAPWWTGTTDQFMGGMGPLGPEMTEQDARWILHNLNQSYQQYPGQPGSDRKPGPQVPWGNNGGGGRPNPNVPPQDNSHTPVQQPVQSSTPFMDAYLRAKQRQEEPNL